MSAFRYAHVTVAGCFDHFHVGQMAFVDKAFEIGKRVSVGIARGVLLEGKFLATQIEPYRQRKKTVGEYIKSKGWLRRASFFRLTDIYGIARDDATLQAVVVTRETRGNAVKINTLRAKKNLPRLDLVEVPMLKGDDGRVIRSWRIRYGAIDRRGHAYVRTFKKEKSLILPKSMRPQLRTPFGKLVLSINRDTAQTAKTVRRAVTWRHPLLTIAVGDIITASLLKIDFRPDIQIIDLRSRRREIEFPAQFLLRNRRHTRNKPGTISARAVKVFRDTIKEYFKSKKAQQIVVRGEEDLLALPAILLAPLGGLVLYGQMEEGVVVVEVTEEKKREVETLLRQFR